MDVDRLRTSKYDICRKSMKKMMLHELYASKAVEFPDKLCVITAGGNADLNSLSFKEVVWRSNVLANALLLEMKENGLLQLDGEGLFTLDNYKSSKSADPFIKILVSLGVPTTDLNFLPLFIACSRIGATCVFPVEIAEDIKLDQHLVSGK